jgi:hypothetical protein
MLGLAQNQFYALAPISESTKKYFFLLVSDALELRQEPGFK